MHSEGRSARTRLIWGLILLVVGAFALAVNLGFRIPRHFWDYWPAIPFAIGLAQMAWPGTIRDRMNGFWLVAVGVYGFICEFDLFGLNWASALPIFIIALGIRIVVGGFVRDERRPGQYPDQNQGGTP
jgi:hypothetical protein